MIPTLVIGLREGVEAALIVGIIAAFLSGENGGKGLREMWIGVAIAAGICIGVAIGLEILNAELPEHQQQILETLVSIAAVGAVTFMIVWLRKHARGLRSEIEGSAANALATGSMFALVAMAFFAVFREGFETAVFLVAVFQDTSDPTTAAAGAVIGLLIAFIIGYGIYRGGTRLDLGRFFRFTAIVLVLVAAGLLASAAHSAAELGWVTGLQSHPLDLSWLVVPGTWTSSLLTGMLGLEPRPAVLQIGVYLAYVVPMTLFVLWPDRLHPPRRSEGRVQAAPAA